MRRGAYTDEELELNKKEYNDGNLAYFERMSDMNAWCHGAMGIGLVRLDAYRRLGDKRFLKDAKNALKKTVDTDVDQEQKPTYTLCHGGGGNAEIFIRAFEVTGNRKHLKHAYAIAEKAIEFKNTQGYYGPGYAQAGSLEDTSLFMGNAGIGYFYLRTLYPESFPSLLLPSVNGTYGHPIDTFSFLNAGEGLIYRHILARYFPETLAHITDQSLSELHGNLYRNFVKLVNKQIRESGNKDLRRAFRKEKQLIDFDLHAPSHTWLATKQIVEAERKSAGIDTSASYVLDTDLLLTHTSEEFTMTSRLARGLYAENIPMFSYRVLKAFAKPAKAAKVKAAISEMFGELSAEEKKEVDEAILSQMNEALKTGKIKVVD